MIDPASQFDGPASLLVRDGRIEAILKPDEPVTPGTRRVDADGFIVSPGFVDPHAHLRFPGQPDKETIASGTAAAIRGGYTTVCAMANTDPPVDSGTVLEEVLARAETEARCRVLSFGGVSRRLQGRENTDASELAGAGVVGLSDDGQPVSDASVMRKALEASQRLGIPVSAHEESHGASTASDSRWPCSGEVAMIHRDIDLIRATGGKLHVAHVSCAESVALIAAAKAEGLPISAEATPHHLALSEAEWYQTETLPSQHGFAKVNPPLRANVDREAILLGLASGVIDAVATDHAPHTLSEKCLPPETATFGFTAFELALPLLLKLVKCRRMNLMTMVERLTVGPARSLGLKAGAIEPGSRADICIFDPHSSWFAGRDTLVSKGKNHPRARTELVGRVVCTLVAGEEYHFGQDHGLRTFRAA